MKCTKCLQVCGEEQLRVWLSMWLSMTCIPWHAKDALLIPLPPGLPPPGQLLNDCDHEDAETQCEDDEPQNDAWQAVIDNGEVQKNALHPRLGAMRVREGHRISHHRGVMVCVKCGGYSMWVNRKLRRDCRGNPPKLGMEVLKRMANREPPRPGQEWPLSLSTWRRQPGCGECLSMTRATLCHARPAWRCGWVDWAHSLRRSDVARECGVSVLTAPL